MYTSNVATNSDGRRRSRARRNGLALGVVLVLLAACSDNSSSAADTATTVEASTSTAAPTTTAAPSTPEAPTTTVEVTSTTVEVSEPIVFEGVMSVQGDGMFLMPIGFSQSVVLEGDLTGHGAFYGEAFPELDGWRFEGDWALALSTPDLGEGLVAVQQWRGSTPPTGYDATGEVVGVSGAFTDLVGTLSWTEEGTYRMELQPAGPSPEPSQATATVSYESPSYLAWNNNVGTWGGGSTFSGNVAGSISGDIEGSVGWIGSEDREFVGIYVGKLDGERVSFIVTSPAREGSDDNLTPTSFFGVSGALEGLRGEGRQNILAVYDATGAFAPSTSNTVQVSR
jgi:hypothetical protein